METYRNPAATAGGVPLTAWYTVDSSNNMDIPRAPLEHMIF